MSEQNLKTDAENGEDPSPLMKDFDDFGKEDKLDTLSWYMVVFGFVSLALAGLCLYLKTIHYRDFLLNGNLLGQYLMMLGVALYVGGRAIKYYKRFKNKETG